MFTDISRRHTFGMMSGSKDPTRSRGTSISTLPALDLTVFLLVPLRQFSVILFLVTPLMFLFAVPLFNFFRLVQAFLV
jgi:hypothetical protein